MAVKITTRNNQQYAAIKDLRAWKDNPRIVETAEYRRLQKQLELGEHSTLLITTDGEVLGGNTRYRAYKDAKKPEAKVVVVEFIKKGKEVHAIVDGIKAERTFASINQAKLEYALSHNDLIGAYDDNKLAELLHTHPVSTEVYKVATAVRPVEDVAMEAGPGGDPNARPVDENTTPTDNLDKYLGGSIKQIVLYFENTEYENVIDRHDALREKLKLPEISNTELHLKLLEIAEKS